MALRATTRSLATVLLKVLAFWVLLVAAYLALGRQFFPAVDRYTPQLSAMLSEYLGVEVSIGNLDGDWQRFNPIVEAQQVQVGEQLYIERLLLEPSVLQSLVTLSPVFHKFEMDGMQANLQQDADGWQFSGLRATAGGGANFNLRAFLGLLRQQSEVRFRETDLYIQPRQLPAMTVRLSAGQLTGFAEENWLKANATVLYEEFEVPLELQIESIARDGDYDVDLYASHGRLDYAPWLAESLPWLDELTVAGQYWVRLRGERWQEATARWFAPRLTLSSESASVSLLDAETEVMAQRQDTGFDLWVNHLGHKLTSTHSPDITEGGPTRALVSRRLQRLQWQWDRLSTEPVAAWLALNDSSGFWRNAAPWGWLSQGKGSLRGSDWQSLRVTADVTDARMDPYAGIPGLAGLDGRLRLEGPVGALDFDSTDAVLQLPDLYQGDFDVAALGGRMDLRWSGSGVQLGGDHPVTLRPDDRVASPDPLQARAQWRVDLPITGQNNEASREVNFRLAVQAQQTDLAWAKRMTPDTRLPDAVKPWVEDNLLTGALSDVAFSFSSSFIAGRQQHQGLALNADFDQLSLTFDDRWPEIEAGRGRFWLDNERLHVQADQAEMSGLSLRQGQLTLPFDEPGILLNASIEGAAENALALFQTGPLAGLGATVVDEWDATGRTAGDLDLALRFDGGQPEVRFAGQLEDVGLRFNDFDLDLSRVNGDLNYSPERGLYAQRLDARMFNEPLVAELRSDFDRDDAMVEVLATGRTPLSAWGQWLNEPWLTQQQQVAPVEGRLRFTQQGTDIELQSDLRGVSLDMPNPLGKTADQAADLDLFMRLLPGGALSLSGSLDEVLSWQFDLDSERRVEAGRVAYQKALPDLPEPGVFIDAHLSQADADRWWQWIQQTVGLYQRPGSLAASGEPADLSWLGEVRVSGDQWQYLGLPWSQPQLVARWNEEAWLLDFHATQGAGEVMIPHDDQPLFVNLDFLVLTGGEDEPDTDAQLQPDPLVEVSPENIPEMNVQLARLTYNDQELGSWRTEVRKSENQVTAEQLQGQVAGAELDGRLSWRIEDNQPMASEFQGQVTTGNINRVLSHWGYAPVLESQNGRFDLDLNWAGSPAHFDFSRLRGDINLQLNNGAILDLEEYEGVKLIGLLNFTRVLRRLALDFTDLIREGITYDVIEGELLFDRGFARVGEQLIIDGPATKFRFSGDADLVRDILDVDMVMTVPLSSTFPLVALLAGVSPQAAAAIYVTERVFNNELERLSSARMHVSGSLESPEVRFYRVFDASGADNPSVGDRLRNVVPSGND
ncbi:MAG: YhdP family phospholipid transporter [Saccharospirillum sp.]